MNSSYVLRTTTPLSARGPHLLSPPVFRLPPSIIVSSALSPSSILLSNFDYLSTTAAKMGINIPFPAMLKLSVPKLNIKKAIGTQSPLSAVLDGLPDPVVGLDMSIIMMAAVKFDHGA